MDRPGRVAAFEIMVATPSIRTYIRKNETFRIDSDIQTGAKHVMQTLDSHLLELYQQGLISYEQVVTMCRDAEAVMLKLQGDDRKKK